jgi:hypothetical protein
MAFRIWRDFFIYSFFFILLLSSSFGLKRQAAFVLCIPKTARSLAITVPHDRLCFPLDTTRFWALEEWIPSLKYWAFAADGARRSEANNRSQQGIVR